jgi:hypothetical protein
VTLTGNFGEARALYRRALELNPRDPSLVVLARDPRSIDTSAPEMAKSAGLEVITGPDGQPAKESISFNERLLPWLGGSGRSNYVRFFLVVLATLIALIVCGSALLIYNAFAISISERKKQFGMFASVGATSAQIRRMVLTEAGAIAEIGIPLGILGAIAGVGILLKLTQGIVSQLIADAEQGMPLVRKGGSDVFFHEITGSDEALSMYFDPRPWLAQVDFDAFTEVATCGESDRVLVCSGSVEQHCAAHGAVESERDCAERDEICVPDHGCMAHARFEVGGQAWRALRNALTTGARPRFVWQSNP